MTQDEIYVCKQNLTNNETEYLKEIESGWDGSKPFLKLSFTATASEALKINDSWFAACIVRPFRSIFEKDNKIEFFVRNLTAEAESAEEELRAIDSGSLFYGLAEED